MGKTERKWKIWEISKLKTEKRNGNGKFGKFLDKKTEKQNGNGKFGKFLDKFGKNVNRRSLVFTLRKRENLRLEKTEKKFFKKKNRKNFRLVLKERKKRQMP